MGKVNFCEELCQIHQITIQSLPIKLLLIRKNSSTLSSMQHNKENTEDEPLSRAIYTPWMVLLPQDHGTDVKAS